MGVSPASEKHMRDFPNLIKRFSQLQIDGVQAQRKYAPSGRQTPTLEEIKAKHPKIAAVNILLYPKAQEWYFPLIVRTTNKNDRHSGQISLPGGSYDESDLDYESTAKRETFEELGISTKNILLIRQLTPVYIPVSNFYVYPYVSWCATKPKFKLQVSEVKELIEMPLRTIFNLSEQPELKSLPSTHGIKVPIINYNHHIIWGATSMILSEFRDLMKKV